MLVAILASCAPDGSLALVTVVYTRPPTSQVEPVVERPGFVWVKGRWTLSRDRWVWVPGHLEKQRRGYVLESGHWEQRGNAWYWVDGRWVTGTVETAPGAPVVTRRVVAPSVYPTTAPPPAMVESVSPREGFVWIPGSWDWRDGQWAWRPGYWSRQEPTHRLWVPTRWEQQGSYYVKVDGHWE